MQLNIDVKSSVPIWEQIVNKTKELILLEVLRPNDKLPSVRELAGQLLVNPNTVSKAYQELERQGVIETLRGKGTFVAERTEPSYDHRKVDEIKEQLKQLIVEATYLNVNEEMFQMWVKSIWKELGGEKHVTSEESK